MNDLTEKLVQAVMDELLSNYTIHQSYSSPHNLFSQNDIVSVLRTAIRSVLGQEVLYTKKEVIELAKKEYRESFGSLNNYPPKQFNGYSLSGLISSALDCNTDTPPTT